MSEKFIVTAALTGAIQTPTMSPDLPITPDEIVVPRTGSLHPTSISSVECVLPASLHDPQ